jgi:hypothetical protein
MSEQAMSARKPREWPSRERWAELRHNIYDTDGVHCSGALVDYTTTEELVTLRQALKERYRELGRELKQIKSALGPLAQQPRESVFVYWRRARRVTGENGDRIMDAEKRRRDRQTINDVQRALERGEVPSHTSNYCFLCGIPSPLLTALRERYHAALSAAIDAYRAAHVARTPIDDAAWQQELERRARIEAGD